MQVEIHRDDHHALTSYASISIAFDVREAVLAPVVGDRALRCRSIRPVYRKDYDAIPGNHPRDWPTRFAVDRAEVFAAYTEGERVGGAMVVVEPSDVVRLGGKHRHALLWDLRVAPGARGRGVGSALLAAIEDRVRELGFPGIMAETQDVNVAACRLYAEAGYRVTRVDRNAYPESPEETQIIWTKMFA